MKNIVKIFVNTLKAAVFYTHTHTHTHTHTDKPCRANFFQFLLIPIFIFAPLAVFAVDINEGDSATCDTNVLNTDTGPVNLRAEFTPENINLKWYNGDTRINVTSTNSNTCTYDDAISLPTNPTKPGYKFKGWKAIPGTRVEYLQSTGTQYVDTGIVPTLDYEFEIKAIKARSNSLIGSGLGGFTLTGTSSNNFMYTGGVQDGYNGIQTTNLPGTINNSLVHIWGVKNNKLYCDDINVSLNKGPNLPVYSFYLFCRHIYNGAQDCGQHKIYYAKIWNNNGILVRDMIPIKDYSGVPCMYDFVSKQKFYNAGTGNFIAGPDI